MQSYKYKEIMPYVRYLENKIKGYLLDYFERESA